MAGADALDGQPGPASGEGPADPAGAVNAAEALGEPVTLTPEQRETAAQIYARLMPDSAPVTIDPPAEALGRDEELPDNPSPVELLIFAHNTTPQALVAAAYFAMDEALRLVCTIDGVQEPERTDFLGLFEHQFMADEAHELISNHGNLPADSLWLHLTARGLMPKTAECFADLPAWQRHGFALFIATYEALLPVVNAMIAERREALRAQAQAQAPAPRVPLSETIFERHAHVSELMDGLRLAPRR